MEKSTKETIHQFMSELIKDLPLHVAQSSDKSFLFLDDRAISLLLSTIQLDREIQLTRLTNRNQTPSSQKMIVEKIDDMMKENKLAFEEILQQIQNN